MNILITGAGGPAGVNALRLLQRQPNVHAFGADVDELSAGRFFSEAFETMAFARDAQAYASDLKRLIAQWKIDIVVPTVAEELIKIREALAGTEVDLVLSPQETLERCEDKRMLYAWMSQTLPHRMGQWQTVDQPIAWEAESYFIKPAHGRGGRGCRRVTATELQHVREETADPKELIVMEVLPGTEWTVDAYVTRSGDVAFCVPRERIALSGGISMKGRTVHQQEVIDASLELLKHLPCVGPVCIQWKADINGVPRLVEVNPRMSGGVMITAAAGADPMACLMEERLTGSVKSVEWKNITVVRYFAEQIL